MLIMQHAFLPGSSYSYDKIPLQTAADDMRTTVITDQNRKTNNRHAPNTPSLGPYYVLTTLITFLRGSYYAHHHVFTTFIRFILRPHYVKEVSTTSPVSAYYAPIARFRHSTVEYLFQSKE